MGNAGKREAFEAQPFRGDAFQAGFYDGWQAALSYCADYIEKHGAEVIAQNVWCENGDNIPPDDNMRVVAQALASKLREGV